MPARTHGESYTPLYRTWYHMKARCNNPTDARYEDYGGRGIKVCERWNNSYEAFRDDMGYPPEGMTLDRKDNNGDYTPENCAWVTPYANMLNRRTTYKKRVSKR